MQSAHKFKVRCLLGEDGEGMSKGVEPSKTTVPKAKKGAAAAAAAAGVPRTAKWPNSETIPLVVRVCLFVFIIFCMW